MTELARVPDFDDLRPERVVLSVRPLRPQGGLKEMARQCGNEKVHARDEMMRTVVVFESGLVACSVVGALVRQCDMRSERERAIAVWMRDQPGTELADGKEITLTTDSDSIR